MRQYKYRPRITKSQRGNKLGYKNYLDWDELSPEDQKWIIEETANINFDKGKGADRDSLIHIVEEHKLKNPNKEYDPSIARDIALKNFIKLYLFLLY